MPQWARGEEAGHSIENKDMRRPHSPFRCVTLGGETWCGSGGYMGRTESAVLNSLSDVGISIGGANIGLNLGRVPNEVFEG